MNPRIIKKENLVPAPCRKACPAGVDAARYIRAIKAGSYGQALAVIRERIPFPTVCADACFAPCEDSCAARQLGEPISIRSLKRSAVDNGGDDWKQNLAVASDSGKSVGILGAGPAGLTTAYYLACLGHKVKVYDAFDQPGGTMRYGIPGFRLPNERLQKDIDEILKLGVEFKGGVKLGRDLQLDDLQNEHDAVFLACGAPASTKVPLPGADKPGVLWGWDFLRDLAQGKEFSFSGPVAVVGGGNVALDAARSALRLGADSVTIVYRRTREEMPAHPDEIRAAEAEGVMIINSWAPKRVLGADKAEGLSLVRCGTSDDPACAYEVVIDDDITHKVAAESVILAIGQETDLGFISQKDVVDADGLLKTEPESMLTAIPGVFAGGDVVSGPSSIIAAIAQGRLAAQAIDQHLGGKGDISQELAEPETEVSLDELPAHMACRNEPPQIKAWQSVRGFEQVEGPFAPAAAAAEANRCLQCDARRFQITVNPEHCKECGYCAEVCGMEVFQKSKGFNSRGYRPMECGAPDACMGCLKCYYACPDFAIDVVEAG